MAWSFAEPDVAWDDGIEHHLSEMAFQFFVYLIGESQASVIHRKQEAFDGQVGIEFGFYYTYSV